MTLVDHRVVSNPNKVDFKEFYYYIGKGTLSLFSAPIVQNFSQIKSTLILTNVGLSFINVGTVMLNTNLTTFRLDKTNYGGGGHSLSLAYTGCAKSSFSEQVQISFQINFRISVAFSERCKKFIYHNGLYFEKHLHICSVTFCLPLIIIKLLVSCGRHVVFHCLSLDLFT